jgi:hypothetical protein
MAEYHTAMALHLYWCMPAFLLPVLLFDPWANRSAHTPAGTVFHYSTQYRNTTVSMKQTGTFDRKHQVDYN